MEIVIDTCVLVDLFLQNRDRHKRASEMYKILIRDNIKVIVPAYALFEIASAMKREKNNASYKINDEINVSKPLHIVPITIDEAFFKTIFQLIYLIIKQEI